MERTNKKLRLCVALLICNTLFIWGNSLLPGSISGAISGWVRDVLSPFFPATPGDGHGLLRKLAHFTEFGCLGALLTWLFEMLEKQKLFALMGAFLVACTDETIQRFVPDRGPSLKDVGIDTCGVLTGLILLSIGCYVWKKFKFKENTK